MPEPTTTDSFSYEGDIQPLMGRYFDMAVGSGASGATQLGFLREQRSRLQNEEAKSLELKARGMQYETAKLALEENRRKSLMQRENMGTLNELQKTLDFGIQLPEEEQPKFFARTSIQFGNLIGTDERAKSMFGNVIKTLPSASKKETPAEKLTNKIFDDLDDVEFGEDYAGKQTNTFKDQGSASKVQRVINRFGTPEEKQGAVELTPVEQLDIARKIRERRDAAILQGGQQQKQQGPRSLFAPQPSP
jgi:hypothetical protein